MSDDKAVFTARDLSAAAATDNPDRSGYRGQERRASVRRKGGDRRANVRFDLDGGDRRDNHGRRREDPAPKPW